jgi:hypothetical protein
MVENIMDQFVLMAKNEGGTHLLNVYKGVPLSFPAKIVEVGDGYLRVLSDTYQMVCMYLEKSTLIQSEYLTEIVQAEVIELDVAKKMALLTNFRYVEKGIGNRTEVRIQPKEPVSSEISDKEDSIIIQGELADISREGIGIYIDRMQFPNKLIYPDAFVDIMLELPGDFGKTPAKTKSLGNDGFYDRYARENIRYNPVSNSGVRRYSSSQDVGSWPGAPNIQIKAQVVNIHLERGHGRYRVGMKMRPNSQAFTLISKFISQRQSEIIQEIKELYQLLVSPESKS